jgi:hypothetical protein
MIFTLSESVKEWLVANNEEAGDGDEYEKMMARHKKVQKAEDAVVAKKEEEAVRKAVEERKMARESETPVTDKSFLEWRRKFDIEMKGIKSSIVKVTGRQIFENSKALADVEVEEMEDAEAEIEEYEKRVDIEEDSDEDEEYVPSSSPGDVSLEDDEK